MLFASRRSWLFVATIIMSAIAILHSKEVDRKSHSDDRKAMDEKVRLICEQLESFEKEFRVCLNSKDDPQLFVSLSRPHEGVSVLIVSRQQIAKDEERARDIGQALERAEASLAETEIACLKLEKAYRELTVMQLEAKVLSHEPVDQK